MLKVPVHCIQPMLLMRSPDTWTETSPRDAADDPKCNFEHHSVYATLKRQLSRLFPNIPCSAPVPDQPPTLKCKSLPPSPDPVSETLHTPSLSMLAYSEGAVAAFEVEGAGVELEAGDAAAAAAAPALASAAAAVVISRNGHSTISSCKHLLAR